MTPRRRRKYQRPSRRARSSTWCPSIATVGRPSGPPVTTVHMTVAVAASPSSATRGLLTMWNVVPTESASDVAMSASIASRPLARPIGPRSTSPSSANRAVIRREIAGIEVLAVVDEELMDRLQVLEAPQPGLERLAHTGSSS